jgi:threonine dehydrogenase-like Zn-dependent dehydrogenase
MKTKAVRMYGKNDLRLEEFELPKIKDDEILAEIISDSICMSSYKAAIQGTEHKRVPNDIKENPIMIGHEFCGKIVEVGDKWKDKFEVGHKFSIQPALNQEDDPYAAPGYSFKYIGGSATHIVIPSVVMELDCLLPYDNDTYFYGSLAEPMSCIVGAFHASYHTTQGSYEHQMGIVEGGNMLILAGAGPMGLGAVDYVIHCDRKPKKLIVTDIDEARLKRAATIYTVEDAKENGVELLYLNTANSENVMDELLQYTNGKGFDDVMVFAPVKPLVELADELLARDGCLNFFSGPSNHEFKAELNFYNVHYNATHIVGTSGGNTDDMIESIDMMTKGTINPASMITHVGGLDSVIDSVLNLPYIPGGKKLIYTNVKMPLVALDDLKNLEGELYKKLSEIVGKNNGIWSKEAEDYLLDNADKI